MFDCQHTLRLRPRPLLNATVLVFFFFNDTATTEIYTLSLHDALPISRMSPTGRWQYRRLYRRPRGCQDRKSTRLNSSHDDISYAVFCLKKKKKVTRARPLLPGIMDAPAWLGGRSSVPV